jgi:integrase
LCPVEAYLEWTGAAQLTTGFAFRAIDRWGHVSNTRMHSDSLIPLLRAVLLNAGVASVELYSGHSLRRGFANWATSNGWDLKTLMEYVGWKNVQSAMRYVDALDPFGKARIEAALPAAKPSVDIDSSSHKINL